MSEGLVRVSLRGAWYLCTYHGVVTISRLLKIICFFWKRAILKRLYPAGETYNFKEPTDRTPYLVSSESSGLVMSS